MHHIIYLSWATTPFSDTQLQELLALSRTRNTLLGVTGILFYGNERFMQVLEGEEEVVRDLYARIRRDPRHDNVLTYLDKPVADRTFSRWGMAFEPLAPQHFERLVGYLGPTTAPIDTTGFSYTDMHLYDLLRSFVEP
jgi:hypothetical protein